MLRYHGNNAFLDNSDIFLPMQTRSHRRNNVCSTGLYVRFKCHRRVIQNEIVKRYCGRKGERHTVDERISIVSYASATRKLRSSKSFRSAIRFKVLIVKDLRFLHTHLKFSLVKLFSVPVLLCHFYTDPDRRTTIGIPGSVQKREKVKSIVFIFTI